MILPYGSNRTQIHDEQRSHEEREHMDVHLGIGNPQTSKERTASRWKKLLEQLMEAVGSAARI